MSPNPGPVVAHRAPRSMQEHNTAFPANCLLCRVLWPTIVGHRHLQFDDSSEAKTLFMTETRPQNHNSVC
jgi:hypothetical protein